MEKLKLDCNGHTPHSWISEATKNLKYYPHYERGAEKRVLSLQVQWNVVLTSCVWSLMPCP